MVGRVQKDINEGNTIIGGIFTSTNRDLDENLGNFMHKAAYSGGLILLNISRTKTGCSI